MLITSHDHNGEIGALVGTKAEGFCEVCDAMPGELHRAPEPKYTYSEHKHNQLMRAGRLSCTDIRILSKTFGNFIGRLAEHVDHPSPQTIFSTSLVFYDFKKWVDEAEKKIRNNYAALRPKQSETDSTT